MAQVRFEFSKIKAPEPSGQPRARGTSLPGTHDFASMIDAANNDGSATAAPVDTRSGKVDRHSEGSSSRRAEPSAPRDRFRADRADRADTTSRLRDDSRPRPADRAADMAEADNASDSRKVADSHDDSDQDVSKTDSDGDTAAGTAATTETVPATAPIVAPVQLDTVAPEDTPADEPTIIDAAAATTTARSGMQTSDADVARAEDGRVTEAGRFASAAFLKALRQQKPGAETAAEDSKDNDAAPAEVPEADAASESSAKAEKTGKGGKLSVEKAEGDAGATAQAGVETAADEPEPPRPDLSDAAKSHGARELPHKDAKIDGATGQSRKKESRDEAAPVRTEELRTGTAQTISNTGSASSATSAGAQAAIGAVGSVSTGTASATSPAATSSRSDAAGAAVPLTDIGVAIATQAKGGHRSFDIRLDPAELGHIHVRLDVDRDGNVISRLFVDRAETLELLRRDAPQLERALQDAGLKADAQTMQFSLRDQNAGQQGGHTPPHSAARTTDLDAGTRLDEVPQSYGRPSNRTGGLDIRI